MKPSSDLREGTVTPIYGLPFPQTHILESTPATNEPSGARRSPSFSFVAPIGGAATAAAAAAAAYLNPS